MARSTSCVPRFCPVSIPRRYGRRCGECSPTVGMCSMNFGIRGRTDWSPIIRRRKDLCRFWNGRMTKPRQKCRGFASLECLLFFFFCSGAREFADYPLPFGGGPSASVLRFRTYRVLSSTPAESCGMSGCIHASVCRRSVAGKPLPPRAVRQDNGAGYRFGGGAFRSFRKISVPYRPLL